MLAIVLTFAAGYAFAIAIAKAGAPKQTVYELPHDFTLGAPTFLPSALPGAALTSGNGLGLLENGDAIFPAMLGAISSARKTVNFEAYIFWSGEVGTRFRDALAERAAHGVEVRVLLDAVGSPGGRLEAGDVDVLRRAGCRVEFFHSKKPWMLWVFNHRSHRRVLVVDGALGFTGGVGFADPWRGNADSKEHWRDTQVRVEGPAVRGLQRAFQENWSEVTGEALVGEEFFPALPPAGASAVAVVPSSPLAAMSGAGRVYAIAIAAATKEIWIANSYFLPDDATEALLVAAVKRGVDVRVLVPSDDQSDVPATKAAGRSSFGPLLEGGVQDLRVPADDVPPEDDGRGRRLLHGGIGELRRAVLPSERGAQPVRLRRRVRRADEGQHTAGPRALPALHARDVAEALAEKETDRMARGAHPVGALEDVSGRSLEGQL